MLGTPRATDGIRSYQRSAFIAAQLSVYQALFITQLTHVYDWLILHNFELMRCILAHAIKTHKVSSV